MPPSEAAPLVNFLRQAEIDAEMAEIERQQLAQRYHLQDEVQPIGTVQSIKHLALSGEAPVAAHVPVVYGCSHACTFCIIPFRRGVERSRPWPEEIVNEVRGLVAQGVREVTLLGPDRRPLRLRLAELGNSATVKAQTRVADGLTRQSTTGRPAARHDAIDGLWRIRFLTSHPNYMTDRILPPCASCPRSASTSKCRSRPATTRCWNA
jgi:tRNA-2-methylthio-N6-dimethylallyladenosine synthase